MGTTANGLPYPESTDPVAEGAAAIEGLATALVGRIDTTLPGDSKTPADPPTSYPMGISKVALSSAAGAAWPGGGASWLITDADNLRTRVNQTIYRVASAYAWTRTAANSGTSWSPWRAALAPYGTYAGATTATAVAGNSVKTVAVSLPGMAFAGGSVYVVATPRTTSPQLRAASVNTESTTGFNLHLWNGSATATDVTGDWVAVQNDTGASLADDPATRTATYATVTCPTEDCFNEGIPNEIAVTYTDDEGNEVPVDQIVCGVCGTTLTPS